MPLLVTLETAGISDHIESVLMGFAPPMTAGTVSANIELASLSLDGPATNRFLHTEQDEATAADANHLTRLRSGHRPWRPSRGITTLQPLAGQERSR